MIDNLTVRLTPMAGRPAPARQDRATVAPRGTAASRNDDTARSEPLPPPAVENNLVRPAVGGILTNTRQG